MQFFIIIKINCEDEYLCAMFCLDLYLLLKPPNFNKEIRFVLSSLIKYTSHEV